MKHSILFVDDDLNVIQGLKRSLRSMADEWDCLYCQSAVDALDLLKHYRFDIIVTDLRMQGMDGANLLELVKKNYPEVIRLVLSGQTNEDVSLRSTELAHQFIAKPCDTAALKNILRRACQQKDMLYNEHLVRVINSIGDLPSLPDNYVRLVRAVDSPDTSLKLIGEILEQDVAMTAKVLQLVNSAFFCLPTNVTSPQRAAAILGINTLRALVLTVKVFSVFTPERQVPGFSMEHLWSHSLQVSNLAKDIALFEGADTYTVEEARTAGLLHDFGKLVEAQVQGFHQSLFAITHEQHLTPLVAEYELLKVSHAELGSYLLGIWGLPTSLVEVVAYHHYPSRRLGDHLLGLMAVHVANALVTGKGNGPETERLLDMEYLRAHHMEHHIPDWERLVNGLDLKERAMQLL
ncbi:MAG: HDOD domain-containing protein [Chloroflexi bacterium]|nr:response regulator [Anaerolineaceae bacterium]NMB87636.1 HDOD domain-containing protein [Chloroflexota bacterium]